MLPNSYFKRTANSESVESKLFELELSCTTYMLNHLELKHNSKASNLLDTPQNIPSNSWLCKLSLIATYVCG